MASQDRANSRGEALIGAHPRDDVDPGSSSNKTRVTALALQAKQGFDPRPNPCGKDRAVHPSAKPAPHLSLQCWQCSALLLSDHRVKPGFHVRVCIHGEVKMAVTLKK